MPKFRVLLALVLAGGFGTGLSAVMGASVLSLPSFVAAMASTTDDVFFRMNFSKHSKPSEAPAVWHLRLPKSFVWMEIGDDDAVTGRPDPNFHSAYLYATIDRDAAGGGITLQSNKSRPKSDGMYVSLTNRFAGKGIANSGRCLRVDDMEDSIKCGTEPVVKRCHVRMDYKGWLVNIMMPTKEYFGDYKQTCMSVKDQIDKYTISVDAVNR